jgi:nucleoside-diphosphate-sugar epimerase
MIAKQVLIIGVTGALGYSTMLEALPAVHCVRVLARTPESPLIPTGVEVMIGTAESADDLSRSVESCEVVFYCFNVPITEWEQKLPRLLDSTLAVCKASGARLVFPGNVWVFGKGATGQKVNESQPLAPISRKGRVRAKLEQMLRNSGARYIIVRLPEFYGRNLTNDLMGKPFEDALRGRAITWYGCYPEVRVEYMFMPDAANAVIEVGTDEGVDGEIFHVPGFAEITLRALWNEVAIIAGRGSRVQMMFPLAIKALRYISPIVRELDDILHLWSDTILLDGSKHEWRFGRIPRRSYEQGIEKTPRWFTGHAGPKIAV